MNVIFLLRNNNYEEMKIIVPTCLMCNVIVVKGENKRSQIKQIVPV